MRWMVVVLVAAATFVPKVALADPPTTCFGQPTTDNRTTDGDDYLVGTLDDDVVALGSGSDNYFSDQGADLVCGNFGADIIGGEGGNDTLDGGPGPDLVSGMSGDDTVRGSGGADTIKGGLGDDVLRTGSGDGAADTIYDGPGNDTIIGDVEDTWYRCDDGAVDDHSAFDGTIVPDPDCSV